MVAYPVLDTPFKVCDPQQTAWPHTLCWIPPLRYTALGTPLGRVLYTKYPSPSNLSLIAIAHMTNTNDLAATAQMTKTDDKYPPMEILMTEYRAPPTLERPPGKVSPYH